MLLRTYYIAIWIIKSNIKLNYAMMNTQMLLKNQETLVRGLVNMKFLSVTSTTNHPLNCRLIPGSFPSAMMHMRILKIIQ